MPLFVPPSDDFWRNTVMKLPAAVLTFTPAGRINFINHTISPFKMEDVIGSSIYDYMSPEYQAIARDAIDSVLKTAKPAKYEVYAFGDYGLATGRMDLDMIVTHSRAGAVT